MYLLTYYNAEQSQCLRCPRLGPFPLRPFLLRLFLLRPLPVNTGTLPAGVHPLLRCTLRRSLLVAMPLMLGRVLIRPVLLMDAVDDFVPH